MMGWGVNRGLHIRQMVGDKKLMSFILCLVWLSHIFSNWIKGSWATWVIDHGPDRETYQQRVGMRESMLDSTLTHYRSCLIPFFCIERGAQALAGSF